MMESYCFKSVASFVDSTHSIASRELSPNPPIRAPSLASVCPKKLTDFSISRILGVKNDETHQDTICSGKLNF